MSDSTRVEVVRHGIDKQGDPFTATYELRDARDGKLVLGRVHPGSHPPKSAYTAEEFVQAGFHLKADCPKYKDGEAIHLRDDFDGDYDAIPECDRPVSSFSSVHDELVA